MRKPKIGNFRLNNLDKPVVQLDGRDGTVKCRYVVHLEIDGIVYVVDRADKLAMGLFIDAVGEGWDPERWKEGIHREIEYLVQDLQKIGHLADELREEADELKEEADELKEEIESMQKSEDDLREKIDELIGEKIAELEEEIAYRYYERWKDDVYLKIMVQNLQEIGHLADELEEKIEYLDFQEIVEISEADELSEEIESMQELEEEKRQKEEEKRQKIESLEQDLREETEYLQELEYEYSDLQELEYEYPKGFLEVSPWKSGKIRLFHGNTEEKIPVEEFKRRHKCKKNRRKLKIRKQ